MPSFLDRQIFRPTGSVDARPEDLGLDYEEVFLTAADGVRGSMPGSSPAGRA